MLLQGILHSEPSELRWASECRCEELVMQVPESTRPLLRQIEAMQEAIARKADSWDEAERSLNLQLQDAEAKAAAAEEKEHSVNKHLSKTLSRNNVLEAQVLWFYSFNWLEGKLYK
ncbi:hypothetical protein HanXRQr2_Chr07g0285951 [Helianthus annuus]|uniref:Uncharacterized protein n=1 Tax=Helianthus annuus TaxID=4232 RepID=A0A9K3NF46_HELAN|nr:hypothetical protein HanXRQr2_Chr07g0285951 [Helianthus annuus]KAJ0549553.1 hypothetical protein HanHA300_Chr07g0235101 [Helianthus annuus]KAJ0562509.1 hypothetical protein HanHA89_Chr07g0252291 [Helianthus annuus]KAJ0727885.1 hypothetical protein HanLR1_Chr07g0235061 [Helianthus annuus]KAJ0730666.1 hypothetical protein HanOQP8_Chr07g0242831 [Helianthus annuus]